MSPLVKGWDAARLKVCQQLFFWHEKKKKKSPNITPSPQKAKSTKNLYGSIPSYFSLWLDIPC